MSNAPRPFMIEASQYDRIAEMREEWRWLVPDSDTPLFVTAFGDWVFGNPDGSLWVLSLSEGQYRQVARNSAEYNTFNKSEQWLIDKFPTVVLFDPAAGQGLNPTRDQCLVWKYEPIFGGRFTFDVANLVVCDMSVRQSLAGQLHRQLRNVPALPRPIQPAAPPPEKPKLDLFPYVKRDGRVYVVSPSKQGPVWRPLSVAQLEKELQALVKYDATVRYTWENPDQEPSKMAELICRIIKGAEPSSQIEHSVPMPPPK
jgi:hypothetical protein